MAFLCFSAAFWENFFDFFIFSQIGCLVLLRSGIYRQYCHQFCHRFCHRFYHRFCHQFYTRFGLKCCDNVLIIPDKAIIWRNIILCKSVPRSAINLSDLLRDFRAFFTLITHRFPVIFGAFSGECFATVRPGAHRFENQGPKKEDPPYLFGRPPGMSIADLCNEILFVYDDISVFLLDILATNRFAQRVLYRDYLLRLIFQTVKVFLPKDRCYRV